MSNSEIRDVPEITWAYDQDGIITQGSYWDQDGMTVSVNAVSPKMPYYKIKLLTDDGDVTEHYSVRVFADETGNGNVHYHIHKYSRYDSQNGNLLHSVYDQVPEIPKWFQLLTN